MYGVWFGVEVGVVYVCGFVDFGRGVGKFILEVVEVDVFVVFDELFGIGVVE